MQDIIPPRNYQRGTIRPPERPVAHVNRPVSPRPTVAPSQGPVFMDGIKPQQSHQSLVALAGSQSKPVIPPVPPVLTARPILKTPSVPPVPAMSRQPVVLAPVKKDPDAPIVRRPRPVLQNAQPQKTSDFTKPGALPAPTIESIESEPASKPLPVAESLTAELAKPEAPTEKLPMKRRKFTLRKHGLIILAVIVLVATGYVAIDTWLTNRAAQALTTRDEPSTAAMSAWSKDAEGKDESEVTSSMLSSYAVSAELPRALYIDKLNIASRIMPMSVNTDGSVQSPLNIFDAGWYTGSVKPGEIGATFIDGHASGATREGLFAYLDTLEAGDTLQVEKGSGERLTYKVTFVETVPLDGLDMKKVLLPHGNTLKGLNIMTCTGKWVEDKKTYDHRVLVYTELVQ